MSFKVLQDGVIRDATPEEQSQAALDASRAPDYRARRASEYPLITDYIDGVVKGDQAQIDAYISACLAVKAKYPKSGA